MIAVEATPDDFRDVYKDISAAAEQHSLKLTAFYNANQEAWNVGLTGYLVSSTWPGMCLNVINVDYWRAYRGLHAIHFALLGEDWTNGNESVADTW